MSLQLNKYQSILNGLKDKIRHARLKAAVTANTQLLAIYWEIGTAIIEQQKEEGWGAKTIERLSVDLRTEFSDMKGLSARNLRYMREFAKSYPHFSILQPVAAKLPNTKKLTQSIMQPAVAQLPKAKKSKIEVDILQPLIIKIPWTHHTIILDRIKNKEERFFYLQQTVGNGWSKSVLSLQIDNKLYQRQGKSINNFENTLPAIDSDLAKETFKNPYLFDFLAMGEKMQERDFEKALLQHLKAFMLELGKGFAYVGNQKNIVVNGDDFFLDLLFYNYNLHCFVVFELKIGDFKPEYAGKLNFYVNTINAQLKSEIDKPTIGVLLCKTPNETVIKYSLQNIDAPIGVSDYKLANALPQQLKAEMPTIEELEKEIEEEYNELKSPSQKRFDALKEKLGQLKNEEIKQTATTPILFEIIDKSLVPLFSALINRLNTLSEYFVSTDYYWQGKDHKNVDEKQWLENWKNEDFLRKTFELEFTYRMHGFKKAGTEAFGLFIGLKIRIDTYWYGFSVVNYNNQEPILKKLYHEQLTQQDIQALVETVFDFALADIEKRIEWINEDKNRKK